MDTSSGPRELVDDAVNWIDDTTEQVRPLLQGRRRAARLIERTRRTLHRLEGRLAGVEYRLAARHPSADVDDDTLAQRVRSELGLLRRDRGIPRISVVVEDRDVTLLGRVPTLADVHALERRAARVSGVRGIESWLSVDPDVRVTPATPTSSAMRELLGAVRALDVEEPRLEPALAAALTHFLHALPEQEARHVIQHLPKDVRGLVGRPRLQIGTPSRPRDRDELVALLASSVPCTEGTAEQVLVAVLGALRDLVPEEVEDVKASLPPELAELWHTPRVRS